MTDPDSLLTWQHPDQNSRKLMSRTVLIGSRKLLSQKQTASAANRPAYLLLRLSFCSLLGFCSLSFNVALYDTAASPQQLIGGRIADTSYGAIHVGEARSQGRCRHTSAAEHTLQPLIKSKNVSVLHKCQHICRGSGFMAAALNFQKGALTDPAAAEQSRCRCIANGAGSRHSRQIGG